MFVQRLRTRIGAGRDNADDRALYKTLRKLRIFHLLADRDLIPLFNKLRDIDINRVIRYAAHRRALFETAGFAGQRELKFSGRCLRVVKEHFIEIAEAVKQKTVFVLLLRPQVFLHHR